MPGTGVLPPVGTPTTVLLPVTPTPILPDAVVNASTLNVRANPGEGATILTKIPQGTQNGQKFRLREKGVFNSRRNTRGDQIVEIEVQTPDVRDERVRELLRQLSTVDTADPRKDLWTKV